MKPKKQKPTVKIIVSGRPRRSGEAQTVSHLPAEVLQKYANDRPLFRPAPRGKKGA